MIRGTIQLNLSPDKIEAIIPVPENQDVAWYIAELLYDAMQDNLKLNLPWRKIGFDTGSCAQGRNSNAVEG